MSAHSPQVSGLEKEELVKHTVVVSEGQKKSCVPTRGGAHIISISRQNIKTAFWSFSPKQWKQSTFWISEPSGSQLFPQSTALIFTRWHKEMFQCNVVWMQHHRRAINFALSDFPPFPLDPWQEFSSSKTRLPGQQPQVKMCTPCVYEYVFFVCRGYVCVCAWVCIPDFPCVCFQIYQYGHMFILFLVFKFIMNSWGSSWYNVTASELVLW